MVANLPTVEVPGYADAVRRENYVRTTAFLGGNESLCGVEVRPLSLRTVLQLEVARNGFFVPCQFESDSEAVAHALQVVWFSRPGFDPHCGTGSLLRMVAHGVRLNTFCQRMVWRYRKDTVAMAHEVKAWIRDAFMDMPKGSGRSQVPAPAYAAYPAYIIDTLHGCGVKLDADQIMDMPLKRLWQHWRVAVKRENPAYGLTNPSDEVFVKGLNK